MSANRPTAIKSMNPLTWVTFPFPWLVRRSLPAPKERSRTASCSGEPGSCHGECESHIDYRDGFTWQPVDVLQNYIPFSAYQRRSPRNFSSDLRGAKDINVGVHHAVRLSMTVRNLTNHTNPLQIYIISLTRNTAYSSAIMGGHYLLDFDFLFFEQIEPLLFQWNRSRLCGGELRLRQNWVLPCVMAIRGNSTG